MAKTSELALLPIFSFKAKDCPLPPCPKFQGKRIRVLFHDETGGLEYQKFILMCK